MDQHSVCNIPLRQNRRSALNKDQGHVACNQTSSDSGS